MEDSLWCDCPELRRKRIPGNGRRHQCTWAECLTSWQAVTGQLVGTQTRGLPTRGLDISRTGQLAH